jgi:two-component system, NtrC family, response regulator AtoC
MTGPGRGDDETAQLHHAQAPERVVLAFGEGIGASMQLRPGTEVVIGRDPTCSLRIDHPSVSRRHAAVRWVDVPSITDLGSKNGTRIGELVLRSGESAPLPPGTVALVGTIAVTVQGMQAVATTGPAKTRVPLPDADHDLVLEGFLRETDALLERIAGSSLSVLLLGETGVGKDAIAEHIHRLSARRRGPLLRLSCAALSESLLESELFGHEQGAFTGAARRRVGLLESADGGTVFLDEVGELPKATQVKLLRVLEDRRITRVGGTDARRIDVRFVSATNRDLTVEMSKGSFREDLYFRLGGVTLQVPPLRQRRDEILPLARAFLRRSGNGKRELAEDACDLLRRYDWPGNVRELRNVIERSAVLANGPVIHASDVVLSVPRVTAAAVTDSHEDGDEARRIRDALDACSGNQTRAAEILGISRRTLVNRLNQLGLPRPRKR